jgi:hypothetical protein
LGGVRSAVYSSSTPLNFEGCLFHSNLMNTTDEEVAVVTSGSAAAPVMLQGSEFRDEERLLRSHGAPFFSDNATLQCAPLIAPSSVCFASLFFLSV